MCSEISIPYFCNVHYLSIKYVDLDQKINLHSSTWKLGNASMVQPANLITQKTSRYHQPLKRINLPKLRQLLRQKAVKLLWSLLFHSLQHYYIIPKSFLWDRYVLVQMIEPLQNCSISFMIILLCWSCVCCFYQGEADCPFYLKTGRSVMSSFVVRIWLL